jgi:hypothetical protein
MTCHAVEPCNLKLEIRGEMPLLGGLTWRLTTENVAKMLFSRRKLFIAMEAPANNLEIQWNCMAPTHSSQQAMEAFLNPANPFLDGATGAQRGSFQVSHSSGSLHVIQHKSLQRDRSQTLNEYYMINGDTYQCPDISTLVSSRLVCHSILTKENDCRCSI